MHSQVDTQHWRKAPKPAFASNCRRLGSNVTGTACHCTTHCWLASCLQEQTQMRTSRKDNRCTGRGKRISNSARRRGQEFPLPERRLIKQALARQCGRHVVADRRKEIKSSGADGVQSPGSLGTIGAIMQCNAAAGTDEHKGRQSKSKTTQSPTRWQHIGPKPGGQPGSRRRQWLGARVAELSREPSQASSSHARAAAAHEECTSHSGGAWRAGGAGEQETS